MYIRTMKKNPSLNDLINHIRQLAPGASVGEDLEGQLIVYTDFRVATQCDSDPLLTFDPDGVQSDVA
ncbi:MAG: hypothetical protein EBR88_01580 [Betaproteobacteria bacterium]|nr:hypothetical protein [Betaproteobacteria bacterium]